MSVFDQGFKFNKEVPYLTEGEGLVFKRMRAKGQLTFYKVMPCQNAGCDNEVPNSKDDEQEREYIKPYCSRQCWASSEGEHDDGHDDDTEDW